MTGERMKSVRKTLQLSQQQFAEALKINASAVSQMENGKIKPSLDTLFLLTKTYGIDLHWLITGQGSMFESAKAGAVMPAKDRLDELQSILSNQINEIISTKDGILKNDVIDIPVTGEIAAGLPVESLNTELDVLTVRKSMINGTLDEYVCLKVNGHSMEPEIRHNDVILIRQNQDWDQLSGKICAVRIDGSITLKKMTLDATKQMIVLVALNSEYQPIIVRPDEHQDVNLIGYLFFLFRKLT